MLTLRQYCCVPGVSYDEQPALFYREKQSGGSCCHADSLAPHLSSAAKVSQWASSTHRTERKGWGDGEWGVAGVARLPGMCVCRANKGEKSKRRTHGRAQRKAHEVMLTSKTQLPWVQPSPVALGTPFTRSPSTALPHMSLCRKAKKSRRDRSQTPGMLHNTRTGTFFLECSVQLSSHVWVSPRPPFK